MEFISYLCRVEIQWLSRGFIRWLCDNRPRDGSGKIKLTTKFFYYAYILQIVPGQVRGEQD